MGRQEVLGFVLIFGVLMVWMWMNTPEPSVQQMPPSSEQTVEKREEPTKPVKGLSQPDGYDAGRFFEAATQGQEKILIIESELFIAEITTKGGMLRKWVLKDYKTWDQFPVQLVDFDSGGDFGLLFTTTDGRLINTRDLHFTGAFRQWQRVTLTGEEEHTVSLLLTSSNGGRIEKTFRFKNGVYGFDVDYRFVNMGNVIANFEYQVIWENGLRYAEANSIDESSFAAGYVYAANELIEVDATDFNQIEKKDISGNVDWVATRNKYFGIAILRTQGTSEGGYIEGIRKPLPDKGALESYGIALKMPFKGAIEEKASFTVFLGPLEYGVLKAYDKDLESIMSLGWVWIVRPISVYVMLPTLSFLRWFIPNWGIVIIVFSILIKIVLHPLTKTSMKSMKKMQALQPMMNEIREKHKDDPAKMNQAIMNLYKEYGVNPAGGCLPLLLQFPILIALYNVFRSAIELRQSSFFWWIDDLSIPDKMVSLPFEIPLFGMHDISGLALFMGITMFIQQKMTIKDPRQKAMIYVMPIMMTLLFNGLPSGLNLYYFIFNLLSIGQQMLMNKQDGEPLRKVEQKRKGSGGIFRRVTKDLPRFKK
jgi:YidC/Oxa1 family membrane protein insertase